MVLLVGAGLLTRAITHAMSLDPGFTVNKTQLLSIHSDANAVPVTPRGLHDALKAAGPTRVAASTFPPITTSRADVAVRRPEQGREMNRLILLRPVSANYFELLGIPTIVGRTFAEEARRREIVLSESAARRFWPNENPIGKLLVRGAAEKEESHEVVGVVADIATTTLTATSTGPSTIYVFCCFQIHRRRRSNVCEALCRAPLPAQACRVGHHAMIYANRCATS